MKGKNNYKSQVINRRSLVKLFVLFFTFNFQLFTFSGYPQDTKGLKETKTIENNKTATTLHINSAVWDVLFNWDIKTQYDYEAGAETDGTYIYTSRYNSTSSTPQFYEYTMSGTLVDSFEISGVTAIRDLAYDGTYFYGGNNGAAIYEMDFTGHTLVNTISCPTGTTVRSIAYDPVNDAFWVGGWDAGNRDFKLINRIGQLINSIPAANYGLTSVYGIAYDGWTAGGPYLWAFDQGQSGNEAKIYQISIATGQQTGVSHDCSLDIATGISSLMAGGLFTFHDTSTGNTILGGCIQLLRVFGYNLSTCVIPDTDAGVIAVTSPISNCGLSNNVPISVKVKNFGSTPITSCKILYQLATFQTDTETISQTIQPGDTANFTFAKQGDFTNIGGYLLTVYTILPGDESPVNDTLKAVIYHLAPSGIPYNMGFEPTDDLTGWSIWDVNNDGTTWFYSTTGGHTGSGYACYNYSVTNQADDWLISSCVDLVQGTDYNFNFYYKAESASYNESMAVYYGNFSKPDSMTTLLTNLPSFNNTSYLLSTSTFTVPVSGSYYFGWYAYSSPNMWKISIDDINISVASSLKNIQGEDTVKVYLNQSNNLLHIESEPDNLVLLVNIWNTAGQMEYSKNEDFVSKDINVSEYPAGMYLVQVKTAKGITLKKIVISK